MNVFSQVPEMSHSTALHPFLSYLKPTTELRATCIYFVWIWRGKRVEHHLGKDLDTSLGNLVPCPPRAGAGKLHGHDGWRLQRAHREVM